MNHTTADYLQSLINDLATLKTNLAAKGVEVTEDDDFTSLAAKVPMITSGAFKVASIAERDALTNVNEGDICIVYPSSIANWQENTQASSITFPETVILPSTYEGDYWGRLENADESSSSYFDGNIQLNQQELRIDGYSDTLDLRVSYYSEDGVTFTRQEFSADNMETGESCISGDTVNLPFTVKLRNDGSEYDVTLGYFMQTGSMFLYGMYTYKNNTWSYTNIGINENGSNYLVGSTGYTNLGITQGIFPRGTKRDLNFLVDYRVGSFKVNDCVGLFKSNNNLIELGFNLDTSDATKTSKMFASCINLKSANLSNSDLSNVTDTAEMFNGCTNLETVIFNENLDYFIANPGCFKDCINLKSINIPVLINASTYNVYNEIFSGCENLEELDIATPSSIVNIINCWRLFYNCKKLKRLNLTNYNFVSNYSNLFVGCTSLEFLDIRSWDVNQNTHTSCFGSGDTQVPASCLIIVKDATAKRYMNQKFTWLTNVKTVAEYEASLQGGE